MEHWTGYNRPDGTSGRLAGTPIVAEVGSVVRLLTPGDVREMAGRLGVRPSKRLGQNFVIEQGTVRRIAALAAPGPGDVVLEVGPGLGSLTLALLEAGAGQVVAVEIDRVLAGELPRTLAERAPALAGRVTVIDADALRVGRDDLPASPSMLVANLPYNVAVPVVLHLLAAVPALARGLVMVQAEVADRMCAPPGSRVYGGPSVKLAWYASGPVGRDGAAQRVLAGAQRRLAAGRVHQARPARHDRIPRGGVRAGRRGVRAAAQDPARRAGRLGRVRAGGRAAAPRGRDRSRRARGIARRGRVRPAGRGAYDFG